MDNKRVYRKIATIFWLLLATMPLWVSFFLTIFSYFSQAEGVTNNNITARFGDMFYAVFGYGTDFESVLFPFLVVPFENLFDTLDMSQCQLIYPIIWFIQVYIIELLIDIFIWLPKFIHRLLEKYGGVE